MRSSPTSALIPCWCCRYFDGMTGPGSAALCSLATASRVRASSASEYAQWERVPGVDDEPGPPGVALASPEVWKSWGHQTQPLPQPAVAVPWAP